jgi:N-methylhydantoinase A
VPRAAGVASAVGLIASDLVVDRSVTRLMPTASATPDVLAAVFAELEAAARTELPDDSPADGPAGAPSVGAPSAGAAGGLMVSRSIDVRFRGQAHQLTVDAEGGPDAIHAAFRACYLETYGIDVDGPTELVTFRVQVVRPVEKLTPARHPEPPGGPVEAQAVGTRPVLFAGAGGFVSCPVFDWTVLGPGSLVPGPAIIEGSDTTVVVPPLFSARVDPWSNLILRRARPA